MDFPLFFTYLAACGAAAATGAMFQPGAWYQGLSKPWWTPKDWMFPVAWTILYISMSVAAMRVAMLAGADDRTGQALAFWAVQIALNTLWTPVFFGLRRIRAGLVVLSLLWVAVAATLAAFWQIDSAAGYLIAPYLLWVTIAGALNASVYLRNPGASAG
ncbi:MAG: TspO/MBR family protein [Pseudotabrizicola sp.]|uniref:tryptophan-rich sensory protein TspO n=1 Tax=Pseudotabrizicola sp. TaxID=2939647 RepID=UPI00272817AD|nr:TspO/MBR family protein [Pseudotabrizicola sp.]MDO8882221.1 TspO/MBR family protein [Pseudotabrizicola sp.]MDP2080979.1 TspO/MBR family protein [Pseudotabrizicola sp.]MDZ7575123.1 TspO/MBR family protein [Pseudotabrizicola sp.]